uniref:Sec1 family domain-containing protein 1 n=1 Tax=Steinernema glaseri TaxID=37863 RepID=A0A1I8A5M4_9BILA
MQGLNEQSVDTIRSRQIAAIKQAINFNEPVPDSLAYEPQWKVLILDKFGQDVISPLLNVKQLRDLGVTLHLLVTSRRESLPDVPAVYFVSPNDENIKLICADLEKNMFYLNMIYPLSRPRLEMLAQSAVTGSSVQQVQKLMDQYLNFISLEDDLFVLRRYNEESDLSYHAINDPDTTAEKMTSVIDTIVDGLFSVCATMGVVPIIRCPKGYGAAEEVATKLDQKIRDNFRDARNNLFTMENIRAGQMNVHRPVLIIADRGMDLATMLHHTWTYQALIHDVLDLDLNRVTMVDKQGKRKQYDMSANDKLWQQNKGNAFPEVAEAVQSDVDEYRKNEDKIKNLKKAMHMEDEADEAVSMLSDATSKLSSTVGSLPELLEKKQFLDLHTSVATAVLDHIKQRKLDELFETEEKILNRQPPDTPLIDLMKVCTEPMDALRLMLINYLCTPNVSKAEIEEQCAYLQELGVDNSAVKFVQRLRSFSNMHRTSEDHQGAGTKTVSMFSKLLNHSSRFVMEGVKNLVPKKHNLPLTKMVDSLIDTRSTGGQSTSTTDEFRYFDPKLMHSSASREAMKNRPGHMAQDVIVFVVGGGNYVEYQNIAEYGKAKGLTRITYGTTEIATPRQFTDQVSIVNIEQTKGDAILTSFSSRTKSVMIHLRQDGVGDGDRREV